MNCLDSIGSSEGPVGSESSERTSSVHGLIASDVSASTTATSEEQGKQNFLTCLRHNAWHADRSRVGVMLVDVRGIPAQTESSPWRRSSCRWVRRPLPNTGRLRVFADDRVAGASGGWASDVGLLRDMTALVQIDP